MSSRDRMFINNLEATLYKGDSKVMSFVIRKRVLVEYTVYDESLLPPTLQRFGISYYTINDFFKYRVCMEGSMLLDDFLHDLGLRIYNFEEIVRRMKGKNNIDSYYLSEIT